MRLPVRGHVLHYLAKAFPQVGPCNWHQMVASSSSITTTRKRPGSIRVPVEQVPCRIPQVPRPSNESPRMNWDHCPKDGKKEFIRMDEYSSLIIVSREKMRKWKYKSTNVMFFLWQILEQPNGMIRDYRIQISLDKLYLIPEITNKSTSILRVNYGSR